MSEQELAARLGTLDAASRAAREHRRARAAVSEHRFANAYVHRRVKEPTKVRRKCPCGCGRRTTHIGKANGIGMILGCELHVARWVQFGPAMRRRP